MSRGKFISKIELFGLFKNPFQNTTQSSTNFQLFPSNIKASYYIKLLMGNTECVEHKLQFQISNPRVH